MTKPRVFKKIVSRETAQALVAMIEMGKVRVFKEHTPDGAVLTAVSASGSPIGVIGERYRYMFETALEVHGSEDGLFAGHSQTTLPRTL